MTTTSHNQEIVFTGADGMPVTREQALCLFNLVADKGNWKLPIDAVISGHWGVADVCEAITFFTGSVAKVTEVKPNQYRFEADGYYLATGEGQ